ncbi:unnamed protein product [Adineta steineri]|uniref:Armadillo repeat-containing domain-containing protein n=1 Tax=Adineta steineri TaxID=433720 RepID=A0A815MVH0_9BILA|nr:unnamed protein product [Adineta steineri]CAF3978911.1 unnamed protein product [Adineta steineri]
MFNRQKFYIGLGISAGVGSITVLYFWYRYYRQTSSPKINRCPSPTSILPSLRSNHDHEFIDINSSSELDNDDSDSIQILNEIQIPDGSVPLTPDQASILTHFLCESNNCEEQLHLVLTSIANASTFKESQINLANAGCIIRLRDLLLSTDNETTKCKILLALNNLALNDFAITQFSNIVTIVINLCCISPANSVIRLHGLNLLINMSVLEYLHEEYMNNIHQLGLLIESTIEYDDEVLSAGKILVNLSINKLNLENLLKITGVELKYILNLFTSKTDQSTKSEDILLRFLTFYCNLAEIIFHELKDNGDNNNNNNLWLFDPMPQRQGALYFEFFDHDKQDLAKSLLRPHYASSTINIQMKRLYQLMDKIHQCQIQLSVSSIGTNNEKNFIGESLLSNQA